LTDTIGRTWLDEELRSGVASGYPSGFGEEVNVAKAQRRKFLLSQGLIGKEQHVSVQTLKSLEQLDLKDAGQQSRQVSDRRYKEANNFMDTYEGARDFLSGNK